LLDEAPLERILGLRTPSGVNVTVVQVGDGVFKVITPCGEYAEVAGGEPIGPTTVVIDPGHGGERDTGARGANGLQEKDVNLDVAMAVQTELVERGISTELTRTSDYATRLGVRAGFADALRAAVLVSIHHNAPAPGVSGLPGTEVFIQSDSDDSRRLGQLIWEYVRFGLASLDDVDWVAADDVGVIRVHNTKGTDAYGMIRTPETVSVLAELGYINNPSEAQLFATDEYVGLAAGLVADAIETYLTTDLLGSGYVDEPRVFNPQPGISVNACEDPVLQ
jgi:N-acetylmuramoyl-L-alanine amidase